MPNLKTHIAWTDVTWGPIRGCSRVSRGCEHCYAEGTARRFSGPGQAYEGLIEIGKKGPRWTGVVRMVPEHLADPLRWRTPKRVFVNSMSDLFHEKLSNEQIAAVFGVMAAAPQHTFQILTKRAERMRDWFRWMAAEHARASGPYYNGTAADTATAAALHFLGLPQKARSGRTTLHARLVEAAQAPWPLANVWLGVSCEDQETADERVPLLLQTPAAVRWVSAEPLLGPVSFGMLKDGSFYDREGADVYDALRGAAYWRNGDHGLGGGPALDWIVVGGESGSRARPFDVGWARAILTEARASGVPVFMKQLGAHVVWNGISGPREHWPTGTKVEERAERLTSDAGWRVRLKDSHGGDEAEWPEDVRERAWPTRHKKAA